jgi:hypothetical protein
MFGGAAAARMAPATKAASGREVIFVQIVTSNMPRFAHTLSGCMLLSIIGFTHTTAKQQQQDVMIWVVAKPNGTTTGWRAAKTWLMDHRDTYTKVSAQTYYIDPTLPSGLGIIAEANDFLQALHTDKIKTLPWVVPKPGLNSTQQAAYIKGVMAHPGPFLDAIRVDVAARGHHGINFDFETWCGHNHRCV